MKLSLKDYILIVFKLLELYIFFLGTGGHIAVVNYKTCKMVDKRKM